MNVTVLSRGEAVRYCHRNHNNRAIIISISDPCISYTSAPFASEKNRVVSVLRLSFADAERPGPDVYGRQVGYNNMMTAEDGVKIAHFLKAYKDTDVIVHCDAGVSRSAGVAAAILKHFTGNDSEIFDNPRFCPNMWCYRQTLSALAKNC